MIPSVKLHQADSGGVQHKVFYCRKEFDTLDRFTAMAKMSTTRKVFRRSLLFPHVSGGEVVSVCVCVCVLSTYFSKFSTSGHRRCLTLSH